MLVGLHTGDDAGVYRLADDLALVQTVDFITPVVDDPRAFGRIAAANSLSDVYAMGGRPLTALNVLCYPVCDVPGEAVREILAGAAEAVAEAGASLVGGHTVDNPELVFGLSVTGRVHPDRILSNRGARPGDRLVLTKPLGLGLVATAVKAGLARPDHARAMAETMGALNRVAGEALTAFGARAATDVTGFGLAGHALAVARESAVDLRLWWEAVPVLAGAREALTLGLIPAGAYRNRDAFAERLRVEAGGEEAALLLCDPQTSGGLLVALPADRAEPYVRALRDRGVREAAVVGEAVPGEGRLAVV
ncbi:MAG: selenide, water dikinase SelD [Deferrisomatales bacterium]